MSAEHLDSVVCECPSRWYRYTGTRPLGQSQVELEKLKTYITPSPHPGRAVWHSSIVDSYAIENRLGLGFQDGTQASHAIMPLLPWWPSDSE